MYKRVARKQGLLRFAPFMAFLLYALPFSQLFSPLDPLMSRQSPLVEMSRLISIGLAWKALTSCCGRLSTRGPTDFRTLQFVVRICDALT